MKYKVEYEHVISDEIEVEANSPEEAEDKAFELFEEQGLYSPFVLDAIEVKE